MNSIIKGCELNQAVRTKMFGCVSGGKGSMKPEKYQRSKLELITRHPCPKTNTRLNRVTRELVHDCPFPNRLPNGFDISEDFDGVQTRYGQTTYINFKCVVGRGGSQTRTLREVYLFVETQLEVSLTLPDTILFANILDGDEADRVLPKFEYLLSKDKYSDVRDRVYVGDLRGYLKIY